MYLDMTSGPQKPKSIYLDFQATTPVDPRIFEQMKSFFCEEFGNPSSQDHAWGWTASRAVENARSQVASLLGAQSSEIFFTSGATESNNWVLFGLIRKWRRENPTEKIHIITSAVEHKSILAPLKYLEQELGSFLSVTYLTPDRWGRISLSQIAEAKTSETKLVSLIWAQNEVGTIQPIEEIAKFCHENKIYLHTDATQVVGKVEINLQKIPVDLLSLSAHKLYGPKGIGALFVRQQNPKVTLDPFIFGGNQERGRRSGTLNTPGIVGLGAACEIAQNEMSEENKKYSELRQKLIFNLKKIFPDLTINSHPEFHLPHALSITFPTLATFQARISQLATSSGSACSSGELAGSPVLKAMGLSPQQASSTLRLSLGRWTTPADIEYISESFAQAIKPKV